MTYVIGYLVLSALANVVVLAFFNGAGGDRE